jgi:hypothetical protein
LLHLPAMKQPGLSFEALIFLADAHPERFSRVFCANPE